MLTKLTLAAVAAITITAAAAAKPATSDWGTAQKIDEIAGNSPELNTPALDGCPILSPDGLQLYMASTRGGTDLNIWVASRESKNAPFGDPQKLPAPVNSPDADFCPTPLPGRRLLFVSNRQIDGVTCGMGDIYLTRNNPKHGWREPRHLGCDPEGPNSSLDEQGPSLVEIDGVDQLFFSRSAPPRPGLPAVPGDLFVSRDFGPASAVSELNSPGNDIQPNVRKDGREIVFSSNHPYPGARGNQDIYAAIRASVDDPWSAPVNIGTDANRINTGASESRPSLSWDARTLLFGRTPGPEGPAGASDIFVSTR